LVKLIRIMSAVGMLASFISDRTSRTSSGGHESHFVRGRRCSKPFGRVASQSKACVAKAPLLATELFETCALSRAGIVGGWFDGPRAWQILIERIEGDGERSEYDKNFYTTALK
jgi:hypothetical protein